MSFENTAHNRPKPSVNIPQTPNRPLPDHHQGRSMQEGVEPKFNPRKK